MGRYALDDAEFSVNGLLDQSENVKTTSGKYYLVGGFRQHRMENPGSLLLQDYVGLNPELESLRGLSSTSINLGAGAGKYWVNSSRFFIGGLLDIIGTYGDYTYNNTTGETSTDYATLSYTVKIGLGYSGEKFKTGFSITGDVTTLKVPGSSYLRAGASRAMYYIRYIF